VLHNLVGRLPDDAYMCIDEALSVDEIPITGNRPLTEAFLTDACGARLQFEQEILVQVVVFRHADVFSSEGADRRLRLPNVTINKVPGITLDTTY
jgi:hypothetical protein